jgi:hypothetical protein
MSTRRSATATLLGAAAGALLSAALLGGPVAHADDIATLPVPAPPFDIGKLELQLLPPGLAGTETITGGVPNSGVDTFQQAYTTTDGDYVVQGTETHYEPLYVDVSEHVISSDGVAPAVGTSWEYSDFGSTDFGIYDAGQLTTADGTVDLFGTLGYDNIYYQGPDGTIDYLVNGHDPSQFIQLFDFPAAGDTAAAINPADLVGLADAHSLATLAADIPSLF